MKCTNHPETNAAGQCLSCRKPFCEDCLMEMGDGTFKCMNCSLRFTLQQMGERRQAKAKTKQIKKLEGRASKKKRAYLRILIPVALGVVIAIVELFLYDRVSRHEVEQFSPAERPSAFVFVIDQAIRDYAADHNGAVPAHLNDLLGKYLPPEKVKESDLEMLTYVRKSPSSYELRAKRLTNDPLPPLSFTEKGVDVGGQF